jgi:hypothetical protein
MNKHKKTRRSKKNVLKKGFASVKKTVRNIIPTIGTGIGNVGQTVIGTAQKTIPKARSSIRSLFGLKTKQSRSRTKKSKN